MNSGGSTEFAMFNPMAMMVAAAKSAGQLPAPSEADPGCKAATLAGCEMVRLASRRARAYMDVPAKLAACRSPQDMIAAQQAFWQQCMQDYLHATHAVGAFWSFAMPVTGMEETLEDESLESCPENGRGRDVMSVNGAGTKARKADGQPAPQQAA